jgi:hypothetical protein
MRFMQKQKNFSSAGQFNKTDAEIFDSLRQLLAKKGKLSLDLIKNNPETPSPFTYRHRFGSLRQAYRLIDYGKPSDFGPIELRRRTQAIRAQLLEDIEAASQNRLTIVRRSGRWRSYLKMKNERLITILVARSIKAQFPIWQIDPLATGEPQTDSSCFPQPNE